MNTKKRLTMKRDSTIEIAEEMEEAIGDRGVAHGYYYYDGTGPILPCIAQLM